MVAASPFDYQVMLTVVHQLLESRQFDRAMPFLFASLNLKDTPFANKWIGQIYLRYQKPQQAQPFLEKAAPTHPRHPHPPHTPTAAKTPTAQPDKARETHARLEQT